MGRDLLEGSWQCRGLGPLQAHLGLVFCLPHFGPRTREEYEDRGALF